MKGAFQLIPVFAAVALLAVDSYYYVQALQNGLRMHRGRRTPVVQVEYTITDLGTLGGGNSHVAGMNARGDVVGSSETGAGSANQGWYSHAFLYSGGKMRDLDTVGGHYSEASAINDKGEIIGYTDGGPPKDGFRHNVLFQDGKVEVLGPLENGAFVSMAGINNSGQITGRYTDREKPGARAFIYSDGSLRDLDPLSGDNPQAKAINNKGDVVGEDYTKKGYFHAFVYTNGKTQDLGTLGGWESYAEAINDKGQIAGGADPAGSTDAEFSYVNLGANQERSESMWLHAFVYSDGKMRDLGPLSDCRNPSEAYCSRAYGINDSGQIVGTTTTDGLYSSTCAFLYSNGKMVDLNTRVDLAHSGFKNLMSAKAINDAGQIVGEGTTDVPYSTHVFLLTPVNVMKK